MRSRDLINWIRAGAPVMYTTVDSTDRRLVPDPAEAERLAEAAEAELEDLAEKQAKSRSRGLVGERKAHDRQRALWPKMYQYREKLRAEHPAWGEATLDKATADRFRVEPDTIRRRARKRPA